MSTVYISRKEHFNAAHKLWNESWTEEKNESVFGKCANKNWHGHNFVLIVSVKGTPREDTGFVMDLKLLSKLIKEHVIQALDHKNLNIEVPFLQQLLPSTENMVIEIWKVLEPVIEAHGAELAKITLEETENNFVEYFGGKEPF